MERGEKGMQGKEGECKGDEVSPVPALIPEQSATHPQHQCWFTRRLGATSEDGHLRLLGPPSPEPPRPRIFRSRKWSFPSPRGSVVQGNLQQDYLYPDHDHSLDQQSDVIASTGPIEDFENGGRKHDERDVEGKAGGGAGTVHGEDLVRVRCDGREDEA